jgi:hypothetical protein
VRKRLVREGVPFIVPGAQMFLPMLMVDLRERFSKAKSREDVGFATVLGVAMKSTHAT